MIPHETRIQLQSEGITLSVDIVDFDEDQISKIRNILRRLGGRFLDLNPEDVVGDTISTTHFTFGVKSEGWLIAACYLVRFYDTVAR